MTENSVIEVKAAKKVFKKRARQSGRYEVKALDDVSISFQPGKIVGLVGESGSGKTTLGMAIAGLVDLDGGVISIGGKSLKQLVGKQHGKGLWKNVQMIFQDPYESLNERLTVRKIVETPILSYLKGMSFDERDSLISRTLELVGLNPPEQFIDSSPRSLSGGERQRVSIARAIVSNPTFLIADEPVSMLDVSIRAGVLEVLSDLRGVKSTSILFVSHDIAIASYLSDSIAVMHLGQIVETGPPKQILNNPKHPYTKILLASIPRGSPDFYKKDEHVDESAWHEAPGLIKGCSFAYKCPFVMDKCSETKPVPTSIEPEHQVSCYLYD